MVKQSYVVTIAAPQCAAVNWGRKEWTHKIAPRPPQYCSITVLTASPIFANKPTHIVALICASLKTCRKPNRCHSACRSSLVGRKKTGMVSNCSEVNYRSFLKCHLHVPSGPAVYWRIYCCCLERCLLAFVVINGIPESGVSSRTLWRLAAPPPSQGT